MCLGMDVKGQVWNGRRSGQTHEGLELKDSGEPWKVPKKGSDMVPGRAPVAWRGWAHGRLASVEV